MLAGGRVATNARGTVYEDEFAEARESESVPGLLVSKLGDGVENFDGLFFSEPIFLSDCGGDLRLGECFCHSLYDVFVVVWLYKKSSDLNSY